MTDTTAGVQPLALIADDDPIMRLLLRQALEGAGLQVNEAADGTAALDQFQRIPPEVVLLDVMMPGMSGFEACAAIRRLHGGEHVPIVVLTGLDDIDSIQQAYDAGATDFMSKPINWLVLAHRVRYILRASHAISGLRESQAQLSEAQSIARLGSWRWNAQRGEVNCSDETRVLLGMPAARAPLNLDLLHARVHVEDREFVRRSVAAALRERAGYSIEYRLEVDGGIERVIHERAEVVPATVSEEPPAGLRGTVQDITNLRRAEERVRFLAHHDPVTQLPNRLLFHERVEQAVRQSTRQRTGLAVMLLDIDNFRLINDTLGQTFGDRMLAAAGQRMKGVIQAGGDFGGGLSSSQFELARFGGDEFAVLLPDIAQPDEAARVSRRLMEAFRRPFRLEEREAFLSLSIGIATFPADAQSTEELLRNAESALFHAKEQGRNNFQFYAPAMNTRALERLTLETQLRRALDRDEFVLHYQPQVDIRSGMISGVEALVRWQHPELGMVQPGQFIPIAEASGLIIPLGEWVMRRACRDAASWMAEGLPVPIVSVNVSGHGFQQPGFYDSVLDAVMEAGLKPDHLALELTESVLMRDVESVAGTLRRLSHIGVQLAVDDFGTGYSSLAYLKRFPLNMIKIDRGFIKDLSLDPEDASIVIAIIQMAHGLCLSVIAEGVETEDQLAFLRGRECDYVQGYLFSRAEPAERIAEMLRGGGRLMPARGSSTPDLRVIPGSSTPLPAPAPEPSPYHGHSARG